MESHDRLHDIAHRRRENIFDKLEKMDKGTSIAKTKRYRKGKSIAERNEVVESHDRLRDTVHRTRDKSDLTRLGKWIQEWILQRQRYIVKEKVFLKETKLWRASRNKWIEN